jgi:hypothetical protein
LVGTAATPGAAGITGALAGFVSGLLSLAAWRSILLDWRELSDSTPDIITPPPNPIAKMTRTVATPAKNDGTLNVLNGMARLRSGNVEVARPFPVRGNLRIKGFTTADVMSGTESAGRRADQRKRNRPFVHSSADHAYADPPTLGERRQ